MAQKRRSLKELHNHVFLFTQTLNLIDKHVSVRKIKKFLDDKHFHLSIGTVDQLIKKEHYAKKYDLDIDDLLDERKHSHKKKSINDIAKSGRLTTVGIHSKAPAKTNTQKVVRKAINYAKNTSKVSIIPRNHYYDTQEVIDKQIQIYYDYMQHYCADPAAPHKKYNASLAKVGLNAIQLKERSKGGALSLNAASQYYLIAKCKIGAMVEVAEQMMSPKELKEFEKKSERADQSLLDSIQLSPDGKRIEAALRKGGIKID